MTRMADIITIVSEKKKVEVNQLAQELNVSRVTIRKDLDKLEERGILMRQHGFAVINNEDDINFRLSKNYDLKRKIALKAAESVKDGETIMIESGSTCTLLAAELAFNRNDVTIITNSCFVAQYIRKSDTVKVILLGGEYQKDSQVNVGPMVGEVAKNFYVDKFFIGVDGFDDKHGFTCNDFARRDTCRMLVQSAKELVILTDSSKFETQGTVSEFRLEEVDSIYTDNGLSPKSKNYLKKYGNDLNLVIV
ncbi:DeoR family transcriptional regulator [Bacilli bacterium]|nr:DeoR family transcriptional regulator [Bacilli bacterium]